MLFRRLLSPENHAVVGEIGYSGGGIVTANHNQPALLRRVFGVSEIGNGREESLG